MATLQKFKLLATQCAIAPSPSRSPNTSPVFQLRRRKTLRRLLSRSSSCRRPSPPEQQNMPQVAADPPQKKPLLSHTLKDLFTSSPPGPRESACADLAGPIPRVGAVSGRGLGFSRGFRYRMLRRVWRPVLLTIPESGE